MEHPNHLRPRLKREEGRVLNTKGNHKLYQDTKGIWTIGYGYNVQEHGLPDHMAEELLDLEIDAATRDARKIPVFHRLNPVRQSVLIAMVYQMGLPAVLGFKNFIAALERGDWDRAAEHMLDSKWARTDSPARARREADLIRRGTYGFD